MAGAGPLINLGTVGHTRQSGSVAETGCKHENPGGREAGEQRLVLDVKLQQQSNASRSETSL